MEISNPVAGVFHDDKHPSVNRMYAEISDILRMIGDANIFVFIGESYYRSIEILSENLEIGFWFSHGIFTKIIKSELQENLMKIGRKQNHQNINNKPPTNYILL